MAVVYRHIRLDTNQVFYIGIGKTEKRAYDINGRNKIWNGIVKRTNYRIDIIFDDLTWENACEKEKEFISLYGRIDLKTGTLANMTDGGEGTLNVKRGKSPLKGRKYTDEHKNNMSKAFKNHKRNIGIGKGYQFNKKSNKYRVRVGLDGKYIHIGCFDDKESAINAYNSFWNDYKKKNNL